MTSTAGVTRPPAPVARTLFALLAEQARTAPGREAVVTATERMTYRDLLEASRGVGAALRAGDLKPGDRVALLTSNRSEWLATAFGCASVGGVLTPYNTWVKPRDLAYLLEHSAPSVLVTMDRAGRQDFLRYLSELLPELWETEPGQWRSDRFPALRTVVVVGDAMPSGALRYSQWAATAPEAPSGPAGELADPDAVAMVLYTSGSTARPKAVPLRHGHLIENGFEIGERQGLTAQDRIFLASPLCWAFGGANALMACLTHGATLVLQDQFEPAGALTLLEQAGCTAMYTLPVMTRALIAEPAFHRNRLSSLRRGLTLGPPAEIRLAAEELGIEQICNIYGSTETYGNCCVTPSDAPLQRRAVSQGPPLPGVQIRIVDAGGRPLGPGREGEIQVQGRITPGYLDAAGVPVPVCDGSGYYHTGDLGVLDEDGWLQFRARDSEMIKTAGINVSPLEVEEFLLSHPDVSEVAVAGGEDLVRGQQVVAFVRLKADATTTPEQLREWCRSSIAGYKVPSIIVTIEKLPTTPTGKLARRDLITLATEALTSARDMEGKGGRE
jgi:fatty-acyl-CoA synthase